MFVHWEIPHLHSSIALPLASLAIENTCEVCVLLCVPRASQRVPKARGNPSRALDSLKSLLSPQKVKYSGLPSGPHSYSWTLLHISSCCSPFSIPSLFTLPQFDPSSLLLSCFLLCLAVPSLIFLLSLGQPPSSSRDNSKDVRAAFPVALKV